MKKNIEEIIRAHLQTGRMLQLATVSGDQPWSCTLYYVADQDMNIYWISKRKTRHSKELEAHSKIAGSIPIKFDDLNVVGLQIEGEAHVVTDKEVIKHGATLYSEKFERGGKWLALFLSGKSPFSLYKITPSSIEVFDRENFPIKEKVRWDISA